MEGKSAAEVGVYIEEREKRAAENPFERTAAKEKAAPAPTVTPAPAEPEKTENKAENKTDDAANAASDDKKTED